MKSVIYAHGGSQNHGCEAIVRSTLKLLNQQEKPILLSNNMSEDQLYGLDKIVHIQQAIHDINKKSFDFFKAYVNQKITGKYYQMDSLLYKRSIDFLEHRDVAFFVGGDNYCYSNVKNYRYINNYMQKKVNKMVLWGASVEPSLLEDKEIAGDLSRFDQIFARESISYNALKKINKNTYLYPDPAFYLDIEKIELPKDFEIRNTIGINISPMIIEHESHTGQAFKNYEYLIQYLLNNTSYKIALIPHVVWESNDDRKPLQLLFNKYKDSKRVIFVDDHNCMQQKYIISQCRFFVGARTHSTIAAYSTCVPTLVVGYSVKARGIARDLFGDENNYIIPVQELKQEDDLLKKFQWVMEHEEDITQQLQIKKKEYANIQKEYARELYIND